MTSHDNVTDIVGRLQDVYGKLTPGAIERADLDGMAFTVADAITDLATLRKQLENAREALREYLEAEEIDDPAIRMQELSVCREQARKALSAIKGDKP